MLQWRPRVTPTARVTCCSLPAGAGLRLAHLPRLHGETFQERIGSGLRPEDSIDVTLRLDLEDHEVAHQTIRADLLGVPNLTRGARAGLVLLDPEPAVWATVHNVTVGWQRKRRRSFPTQISGLGP